jgi:3-phenylpropionate/cinnamic acid dioxygenase small subunit
MTNDQITFQATGQTTGPTVRQPIDQEPASPVIPAPTLTPLGRSMAVDAATAHEAITLVHEEALALDAQRWDDWLDLYTADATFWLPTWTDDHTLSQDPQRELSLIWCAARAGLEDRVWRVRCGLSNASQPLPRTTHLVAGSVVTELVPSTESRAAPDEHDPRSATGKGAVHLLVRSNWTCHVHRLRRRADDIFHGHVEHRLRRVNTAWRIVAKTVILRNDTIPTMIDFYCV